MKYITYFVLRTLRRFIFYFSHKSTEGYNDSDFANQIVDGDRRLWNSQVHVECLMSSWFASNLESELPRPISILDFGGGGGRHGFSLLRAGIAKWVVVETPELVRAAEQSLAEIGIVFVESISEAKARAQYFDVVHVSSALQYTERPLEVLYDLLELKAEYLFFEKLVLTRRSEPFSFTQYSLLGDNIPSVKQGVRNVLTAVDYKLNALPVDAFIRTIERNYYFVERGVDEIQSHLPSFKGLNQFSMVARRRKNEDGVIDA